MTRSRYAQLFQLSSKDYMGWAKGLKETGYATDKNYDKRLIHLIEKYQLYQYDDEVTPRETYTEKTQPKESKPKTNHNIGNLQDNTQIDIYTIRRGEINRVEYVVAEKGDTWQSLTQKYQKMPWELYRYNDISREMPAELIPGQIVYLQPKRRKADVEYKYHILAEGETMWEISQKYAIKLKHLYRLNRLTPGEEPPVGTKIYLRRKKPKA